PSVDHSRPGIGTVRHHDAELQRAEPGTRGRVALQEVLDLLIDRDSPRPSGRSMRADLNVSRKQLDPRQQAADAAHVIIAVAANLVADAVKNQGALLERLQRLEALRKRR